jgi:gluconolactonase
MIGVMMAVWGSALLQAQPPTGSSVNRLDSALDELVSSSASVETLKNEFFAMLEGPVWVQEGRTGYLLFSDMPANCIYKWQDGKLSVFLEKSGFTGTDSSVAGVEVNNGRFTTVVLGSNGLTLDPQGRLVIAQHGDRQVVRLEKDGTKTVLADRYEGKRINSPNDLVIKSNGSLYFSDPASGLRGGDKSPLKEQPVHGIYLVKNGTIKMVDKDPQGSSPNGLALSPDEKTLYATAGRKLVSYDVMPDDSISNPRVIFDYDTVTPVRGGFDGLKVDSRGNVWGTGPGGVWIVSPSGKALGQIRVPEDPANLAFGDADGKGLYFAARRGLYRIRLNVAGIRPGPK